MILFVGISPHKSNDISIDYFPMEIRLESAIRTYSGGLGVLAGDTLQSAADASLSMAGVTLYPEKDIFGNVCSLNALSDARTKPDLLSLKPYG